MPGAAWGRDRPHDVGGAEPDKSDRIRTAQGDDGSAERVVDDHTLGGISDRDDGAVRSRGGHRRGLRLSSGPGGHRP